MKLLKLVPEGTNLDFMRWRNLALVLSLIATVASIGFTAYRGLNLGVDFVGGQLIRGSFAQPIDVEQLRGRVDGMHFGEASITEFGGPKTFQIRLPRPPGSAAAANSVASPGAAKSRRNTRAQDRLGRHRFRARSARSWRRAAPSPSASRCSGSPSTSGSASNGSSGSARC